MVATEKRRINNWVPVEGIWDQQADVISFVGKEDSSALETTSIPRGIALSGVRFANGRVKAEITLPEDLIGSSAQIMLGFSSPEFRGIFIGLNGTGSAFLLSEHVPGLGWRTLSQAGASANLRGNHPYNVEVGLEGQRLTLSVDGIKVMDHLLNAPLSREQLGLFAHGNGPIRFSSVEASTQAYSAFVVMQFTEQFNELYDEVIRPVCEGLEVNAYRASDIYRPGAILQDILQGLDESYVVIADVTPANPNVFYELGYSHALKKPVILLAERGTNLPFDISGYRVIFYDNTIGGKSAVEADLRRHLTSILGE